MFLRRNSVMMLAIVIIPAVFAMSAVASGRASQFERVSAPAGYTASILQEAPVAIAAQTQPMDIEGGSALFLPRLGTPHDVVGMAFGEGDNCDTFPEITQLVPATFDFGLNFLAVGVRIQGAQGEVLKLRWLVDGQDVGVETEGTLPRDDFIALDGIRLTDCSNLPRATYTVEAYINGLLTNTGNATIR